MRGFTHTYRAVELRCERMRVEVVDTGAVLLDDVTARIPAGAFAAVMGPSGAGKTTFMNALSGVARVDG